MVPGGAHGMRVVDRSRTSLADGLCVKSLAERQAWWDDERQGAYHEDVFLGLLRREQLRDGDAELYGYPSTA